MSLILEFADIVYPFSLLKGAGLGCNPNFPHVFIFFLEVNQEWSITFEQPWWSLQITALAPHGCLAIQLLLFSFLSTLCNKAQTPATKCLFAPAGLALLTFHLCDCTIGLCNSLCMKIFLCNWHYLSILCYLNLRYMHLGPSSPWTNIFVKILSRAGINTGLKRMPFFFQII